MHCSCQKTSFSGSLNSAERVLIELGEVMLLKKNDIVCFSTVFILLNDFQIKWAVWCQRYYSGLQFEANKIFSFIIPLLLGAPRVRVIVGLFRIAPGPCGNWVLRWHVTVIAGSGVTQLRIWPQPPAASGSPQLLNPQIPGWGIGVKKGIRLCALSPSPDKRQGSLPRVLGAPNGGLLY